MKVDGALEQAKLEQLSADPTGDDLYEGRIWYNTTDEVVKNYDSGAVRTLNYEEILGVADGDTDLGTFTGDVITDNTDVKSALQEVGTVSQYGITNVEFDSAAEEFTDNAQIEVPDSRFSLAVPSDSYYNVIIRYQFEARINNPGNGTFRLLVGGSVVDTLVITNTTYEDKQLVYAFDSPYAAQTDVVYIDYVSNGPSVFVYCKNRNAEVILK